MTGALMFPLPLAATRSSSNRWLPADPPLSHSSLRDQARTTGASGAVRLLGIVI